MTMMIDAHRAMLRSYGTLVGRILLGLLFLVTGFGMLKAGDPGAMLASMDIPLSGLLGWPVVALKLLAGAGLVLGYRVGLSAAALFVFTLLTVVLVHSDFGDPMQQVMALKNLSIMGGLLYVMAYGPGEGWKLGK